MVGERKLVDKDSLQALRTFFFSYFISSASRYLFRFPHIFSLSLYEIFFSPSGFFFNTDL